MHNTYWMLVKRFAKDRSRGREWQYDELCNYIGSCINSHDKIANMGLESRCISVAHSKRVSFIDHTSHQRQDFERDFKFYMKNFREQVPQPTWNKFTKKQQQIILEARKGNSGSIVAKTPNFKRKASVFVRGNTSNSSTSSETLPRLMEQLQKLNTTVSALSSRVATISSDNGKDNSIGNQFGGQTAAKQYKVSEVVTLGHRKVLQMHSVSKDIPLLPCYGSVELDTHADTCVVGKNFVSCQLLGGNVMFIHTLSSMRRSEMYLLFLQQLQYKIILLEKLLF
jgi:hypothetical protein